MSDIDPSGANWRKSARSNGQGACVEVGHVPSHTVAVRDTQDRRGPALAFQAAAWKAFTADVRADRAVSQ